MVKKSLAVKGIMFGALLVGMSQASMVTTNPEYGDASHGTTQWQSLGKTTNNDGVYWSLDGGTTFTNSITDFQAGQTVTFRFEMYKQYWGVHSYDGITVWMDKEEGNNLSYTPSDIILKDQWNFNFDDPNLPGVQGYYYNGDPSDPRVIANQSKYFFANYTFSQAGEYDMRARVSCSSDINGQGYSPYPMWANTDWNLNPTGYYGQGEVEDYEFNVKAKKVPEPTLLSLLGFGLIGLAAFRRKK